MSKIVTAHADWLAYVVRVPECQDSDSEEAVLRSVDFASSGLRTEFVAPNAFTVSGNGTPKQTLSVWEWRLHRNATGPVFPWSWKKT